MAPREGVGAIEVGGIQPMIEFFSTLVRLFKAIVGAWRRDPQFRTLLGLVSFTLLSGTIFYSLQEGWSIVNAFYFSVTTLTTVGLGDLSPTTTVGKLFTVIYIFAGLSLVLGFIEIVAKETLRSRMRGQGGEKERESTPGS
jgi:voltage-gated potassium channel